MQNKSAYLYLDHLVSKREGPKGQKTNVFQTRDHKNLSCLQLQNLQIERMCFLQNMTNNWTGTPLTTIDVDVIYA